MSHPLLLAAALALTLPFQSSFQSAGPSGPLRAGQSPQTAGPSGPSGVVLRRYDFDSWLPRIEAHDISELLLPYLANPMRLDYGFGVTGESWKASDEMVDLILQVFGDQFDEEGRSIQYDEDGRLSIVAPRWVHENLERLLPFLARTFQRSASVRLEVLEVPAGAALTGSVLDRAAAQRLAAGATSARSYDLRVYPDRYTQLEDVLVREVVARLDTEVAQRISGYDPVIESFPVGLRLGALAGLGESGVALDLLLSEGAELRAPELVDLEVAAISVGESGNRTQLGSASAQTLSVRRSTLALSTFLPVGKALVFEVGNGLAAAATRQLWVFTLESDLGPALTTIATPDGRHLELLDLSGGGRNRFVFEGDLGVATGIGPRFRPGIGLSAEDGSEMPPLGVRVERIDPPAYGWIENEIYVDSDPMVNLMGSWLMTLPDEGADDTAHPLADMLAGEELSQFTAPTPLVELSVRLVDGEQELARVRVPAASGRELALTVGTEALYHGDTNIEIAEGSVIANPHLYSAFQGLVLRATPRSGLGGLGLDLEAHGSRLVGPGPRGVDIGTDTARTVQLGAWRSCHVRESVSLPAAGTTAPLVFGDRHGLHLEVELR